MFFYKCVYTAKYLLPIRFIRLSTFNGVAHIIFEATFIFKEQLERVKAFIAECH